MNYAEIKNNLLGVMGRLKGSNETLDALKKAQIDMTPEQVKKELSKVLDECIAKLVETKNKL